MTAWAWVKYKRAEGQKVPSPFQVQIQKMKEKICFPLSQRGVVQLVLNQHLAENLKYRMKHQLSFPTNFKYQYYRNINIFNKKKLFPLSG